MAVIEPAHERDVQLAVPVLANLSLYCNFPFRIRSGGHHKAAFSTVAEGAVLSMVRLHHVHIHSHDASTGSAVATMGPAVTVARFLSPWLDSLTKSRFLMDTEVSLGSVHRSQKEALLSGEA